MEKSRSINNIKMSKYIRLTHEAVATYSLGDFEQAVILLGRAFEQISLEHLDGSNATYNALFDAVEMVEALFNYLPILEKNADVTSILHQFKTGLEDFNTGSSFLEEHQIDDFKLLLKGLQVGFNFFLSHQISLQEQQPMLSFAVTQQGEIQLIKWQNSPKIDQIVADFTSCFAIKSKAHCQQAYEKALAQGNKTEAKRLLVYMMDHYPESKKQAFLDLGDLYFEENAFQKATEAYMKTIVLGTAKEVVRPKIQVACNALAANATNSKEAGRWRDLLMNFF